MPGNPIAACDSEVIREYKAASSLKSMSQDRAGLSQRRGLSRSD